MGALSKRLGTGKQQPVKEVVQTNEQVQRTGPEAHDPVPSTEGGGNTQRRNFRRIVISQRHEELARPRKSQGIFRCNVHFPPAHDELVETHDALSFLLCRQLCFCYVAASGREE